MGPDTAAVSPSDAVGQSSSTIDRHKVRTGIAGKIVAAMLCFRFSDIELALMGMDWSKRQIAYEWIT